MDLDAGMPKYWRERMDQQENRDDRNSLLSLNGRWIIVHKWRSVDSVRDISPRKGGSEHRKYQHQLDNHEFTIFFSKLARENHLATCILDP